MISRIFLYYYIYYIIKLLIIADDLTVTMTPIVKHTIPRIMNKIPRPLAKSGPTEDTFRQCGHRARALLSVLNCNK